MTLIDRKFTYFVAVLTILSAISLAYFPGLSGGFMFDDQPNIVDNQSLAVSSLSVDELWHASFSTATGPLKRPVAMLTLALNHYFSVTHPFYYKVTNLVIHLLSTLFVGALAWLLVKQTPLRTQTRVCASAALLTMALWGLHPYNLTSVLYVIQRMTSLAGLFSFTALVIYAYCRPRLAYSNLHLYLMPVGVLMAGTLAIFSKESALLLPLQIMVLEITLFRETPLPGRIARTIRKLLIIGLIASITLAFIKQGMQTDWISAYAGRDFSLFERVLTESRILWVYLQQILLPNIATMGLFLDDFEISKSWLQPPSTIIAVITHLLALMTAILIRKKIPVLSFSILWFYACHLLESTIFPLELMFEHRNYMAMFGPIFGLVYCAFQIKPSMRLRQAPLLAMLALTVIFAISTTVRASYFGNWIEYALYEAEHHPESARANFYAGRTFSQLIQLHPINKEFYAEKAFGYYNRAESVDRTRIEPKIGMMQTYVTLNQPIPDTLISQMANQLRTAAPGNNGYYISKGILDVANVGYPKLISRQQVEALYLSALENSKIRGNNRGYVNISMALFKCNVLQACREGIPFAEEAIVDAPGLIEFKVILASLYLMAGEKSTGNKWLDIAERQDSLGYFTPQISALKQGAVIIFGAARNHHPMVKHEQIAEEN
jgi:hypothetical protein